MPDPILLILGPSGVGKTTIGEALAKQTHMLHLDFDQYPKDGVDEEGLRAEWDAFLEQRPAALADAVLAKVDAGSFRGAVITCPSGVVLSGDEILDAERCGFRAVVLFGPPAACRAAFLNGPHSGLGAAHWDLNNRRYAVFGSPELESYRVAVFRRTDRRPVSEILAEVQARLTG
jgi:hypothetical protein